MIQMYDAQADAFREATQADWDALSVAVSNLAHFADALGLLPFYNEWKRQPPETITKEEAASILDKARTSLDVPV